MKRVYILRTLTYKHTGATLRPFTPYLGDFDSENGVWRVHVNGSAMVYAVLPKFVEKVVDIEPALA